jgi:hypothetical protein
MGLLNCRPLWRGGGLSRWLTVRCALFPATMRAARPCQRHRRRAFGLVE